MGRKIIVENDKVEGTDQHNVTGKGDNPALQPPKESFSGVGDFDYRGKMTDLLSDFVRIGGKPVALKSSKSSLNPGDTTHKGENGSNFVPGPGSVPKPDKEGLSIIDSIGNGVPSSGAGSIFVKIGTVAVLLDSDKIDTCGTASKPMNSTVTSQTQDFVKCSA